MYINASFSLLFGNFFKLSFKYRDRASIIGDILSAINSDPKGKTKTSIMRGANLNLEQVNRYLQLLMLSGLIKAEEPLTSQELARYRLTKKGLSVLREYTIWRFALTRHRSNI
jgi:predicted transcriptional regulator